ncbi:hypothetical protein ACLX1H_004867 [Fusarium chlamydosporum]
MLLGRNRLFTLYASLATIWVILFQLCRLFTYTDPSSFFYDSRRAYETRYTDLREKEVDRLIDTASHNSADEHLAPAFIPNEVDIRTQDKSLCIGIPSVKRENQYFLPRALASLVADLDAEARRVLHVVVLLADDDAASHPAFGQLWLERLSDEILFYSNVSLPAIQNIYRKVSSASSKQGGKLMRNDRVHRDYATLMSSCRGTGADYFILIEDDVIAARGWLSRLMKALEYLERTDHLAKWLYLRLFYSETYLGWNSEEWPIYLSRAVGIYTVVLAAYIIVVTVNLRRQSPRVHVKSHTQNVLHLTLWTASFIALYFLAGRLTVDPYKEGVREMPNYGCCAQGLVIPHQHLSALEDSLHTASVDIAGDSLIEQFAGSHGLKKYAI